MFPPWQDYTVVAWQDKIIRPRPKKAPAGLFGKRTLGVGDLRHNVLGSVEFFVG